MWLVLMLGAVVTVAFTYLFGSKHGPMRSVMAGALGLLIGLVLFLTVSLDYPFRGGITDRPRGLRGPSRHVPHDRAVAHGAMVRDALFV